VYIAARKRGEDLPMPGEPPPASVERALAAAKIVGAYVQHNQIAPEQMASLISTVLQALANLGRSAAASPVERTPAVSIRRSVQRDFVVCLDCGWKAQVLRRHLSTAHGLTVEQYRERWNLPADHAMTAPCIQRAPFNYGETFWPWSGRSTGAGRSVGAGSARKSGSPTTTATRETAINSGLGLIEIRSARRSSH
jgi:predicted transcriptional regulator